MMVQATSPMRAVAHAGVFHAGSWAAQSPALPAPGARRSGQRQGGPLVANVCQLNIVHYDEVIEMTHQGRDLVKACIQQQIAGAPVYVAVTLDAPLYAQQKAVISLSFGERLHRV